MTQITIEEDSEAHDLLIDCSLAVVRLANTIADTHATWLYLAAHDKEGRQNFLLNGTADIMETLANILNNHDAVEDGPRAEWINSLFDRHRKWKTRSATKDSP